MFAQVADNAMRFLYRSLRAPVTCYCDLETVEGNTALVGTDGSLVSLLRITGINRMIGGDDFDDLGIQVADTLNPFMAEVGHRMEFVFERDPDASRSIIENAQAASIKTTERLGLALDDVHAARLEKLAEHCSAEETIVALWTLPTTLPKAERKTSGKRRAKAMIDIPQGVHAQTADSSLDSLRNPHESFVQTILLETQAIGVSLELLDNHEALRVMRTMLFPAFTAPDWRARLPGDPLPVRVPDSTGKGDLSSVLYPAIEDQIFPQDAEVINPRTVRVGTTYHSPVIMSIGPQKPQPFQRLFNSLLTSRIPWRINITLEGDGLSAITLKATLASLFYFTNRANRRINRAIEQLRAQDEANNESVRFSACFDTWGKTLELSQSRASTLARAIQSWGSCDVEELLGDPLIGVCATIPGLTRAQPATVMAAPVSDVAALLPLTRPMAPWKDGAVLLRSPDGRLMPYQPGSSLQTASVELVVAPMGFGKSVFLNANNLALAMTPGLTELPYILILDIGPSSRGMITLLRDALPPEKRHLAVYQRLQMRAESSMNPFDTLLGCREPLPYQKTFLANFLALLATPVGADAPYDGVTGLVDKLIKNAYEEFSPNRSPKLYDSGICTEVDAIIEDLDWPINSHTSWWDIVDALFDADRIHAATLAQRYAVPLLSDLMSLVRQERFSRVYGHNTPTGETMVEFMYRAFLEGIDTYPILKSVTQFDLGDSRIVSLDLAAIAPKGSPAADKQTALMYMLARHVGAQKIYLHEDDTPLVYEPYRQHHARLTRDLASALKRICNDEYHRTAGIPTVRAQTVEDVREGRKRNILITLASQRADDFDEAVIDLSTSVFVFGAGNDAQIDRIIKQFGFPDYAKYLLKYRINKPDARGANLLSWFKTNKGVSHQYQTLSLSARELWAYNTTAEDMALRDQLTARVGSKIARDILVSEFPSGGAKAHIHHLAAQQGADDPEEVIGQLVDKLAALQKQAA